MTKTLRWLIGFIGIVLFVFTATIILRWESLPWSPGYDTGTSYVPPLGEVLPTPTFFSPSVVTPTNSVDLVWIDPNLPELLRSQLAQSGSMQYTESESEAGTALKIGDESPLVRWIFALTVPFPTVGDGVSSASLRTAWEGGENLLATGQPLLISQDSLDMLSAWWGAPAPGSVEVMSAEQLLDYAWSNRPSLAILPFQELSPSWKVLKIDGISPLDDEFNPDGYLLSVPVSAVGAAPELFPSLSSNRDPDKFTSVVLTGVTALVRATAWTMENQGVNYPAQDIKDWLLAADILHISNEVPFLAGCPFPNPSQVGLRFCSDPRYIQLMDTIGTDVVELTGDHFGDYGPEAMLYTLELYRERGWPYYGGGATRQEAQEPVLFEHNGNKIAFLGCNAKGGGYATAGPQYPGAVACDFEKMTRQIRDLRAEGYQPIATFQHFEYYTYLAQPDQIRDARTLTKAGAVIVSGSQAHQPQGLEIGDGWFVHHGLGNLFFDQIYEMPPNTATAFIDRHIFYNGRHISTELLTIKFLDYARARPMTSAEREELLRVVFNASGWW
jgi:hypothetical protein